MEYIKDWIQNKERNDYSFKRSGIILFKMLLLVIKIFIIIVLVYLIILFAFKYDKELENRMINDIMKDYYQQEEEFYKKEVPNVDDYLNDKE